MAARQSLVAGGDNDQGDAWWPEGTTTRGMLSGCRGLWLGDAHWLEGTVMTEEMLSGQRDCDRNTQWNDKEYRATSVPSLGRGRGGSSAGREQRHNLLLLG